METRGDPPPQKTNAAPAGVRGGVARKDRSENYRDLPYKPNAATSASLVALLLADPVQHGCCWSVDFEGEVLVTGSKDPELDLARALLDRGITGTVTILDGNTGKPRTLVNIEKAARLTVREDRSSGPRFVKWRPMPQTTRERCEGRSPAGESALALGGVPTEGGRAVA